MFQVGPQNDLTKVTRDSCTPSVLLEHLTTISGLSNQAIVQQSQLTNTEWFSYSEWTTTCYQALEQCELFVESQKPFRHPDWSKPKGQRHHNMNH